MSKSIVIDKDGNVWGPFDSAIEAANWAEGKWPDQEQDEAIPFQTIAKSGWDIWALREPD